MSTKCLNRGNGICGRRENTGEVVLLTMGSAGDTKTQVGCQNTCKYTGHKFKTFLPAVVVINVRHFYPLFL